MNILRKASLFRVIPCVLCICVFPVLTSPAFALDSPLRTESASPSDLVGTFTLLLYGGRYADDIETVAIFAPEGGKYTYALYALLITKQKRACRPRSCEAGKFVSFHNAFWCSQLSRDSIPTAIPSAMN